MRGRSFAPTKRSSCRFANLLSRYFPGVFPSGNILPHRPKVRGESSLPNALTSIGITESLSMARIMLHLW